MTIIIKKFGLAQMSEDERWRRNKILERKKEQLSFEGNNFNIGYLKKISTMILKFLCFSLSIPM